MQIQDMIELMKHMNRYGISLLEYEADGWRLRLEKPVVATVPPESGSPDGSRPPEAGSSGETAQPSACQEGQLITAPVVGIFYAASSPDSDPYVSVGSVVEAGTTVCIIEAMKLMNEVTSNWAGKVLEILVQDGQRVEYGQPLMRIGET